MKQGKQAVCLLAGMILLIISACASVPLAPPEADMKARNMSAPKDKALVYLYRNQVIGAALKMAVHIDGKYAGDTAANTYLMQLLPPGKHEITSVAGNIATFILDARAGETYYIWQSVESYGGSKLQRVDSGTGRQGVNESKLILPQEGM